MLNIDISDSQNCILNLQSMGRRTEKLSCTALSFDFVYKPPSLISPPLGCPKSNKPPGLIRGFTAMNDVFTVQKQIQSPVYF